MPLYASNLSLYHVSIHLYSVLDPVSVPPLLAVSQFAALGCGCRAVLESLLSTKNIL